MEVVAVVASVVSAVGSIQSGYAQQRMYKMQGEQARLAGIQAQLEAQQKDVEYRMRAFQYEQRAGQVLDRLYAVNAAARAKAYAGGVSGFDGSAALVQSVSGQKAAQDFDAEMFNSAAALKSGDMALRSGEIALAGGKAQKEIYNAAGRQAVQAGYFDAIGKLGMAAYSYSKIGGAPARPAPVEERSIYAGS